MDASTSAPPSAPSFSLTTRVRRIWLALLFFAGLGYAALVPPFHAIDEIWHWERLWTVVQGDYNCVRLPHDAPHFEYGLFAPEGATPQRFSLTEIEWAYRHIGPPGDFLVSTAACGYPPTGYLPSALAMRALYPTNILEPREHKMFYCFYAARLANWLFFFTCLVFALRIGLYPVPIMLFASIPMVVQQAAVLNNEAVQFGALLLSAALLTSARLTRYRLAAAILLVAAASSIKPINAIAALIVWLVLYRLDARGQIARKEALSFAALAVVVPVGAWLLWHFTMDISPHGAQTRVPIPNVDPQAQLALIKSEPLRLLQIVGWQLKQLYTGIPIDGGWRGIFFVFGWCKYVAPNYVYALILAAIAAGLPLLRTGPGAALMPPVRTPKLFLVIVAGAMFAYFTAVTLALYMGFTPVGNESVFGVQGRYYHVAIATGLFLYPYLAQGPQLADVKWRRALAPAFVALSIAANVGALRTLWAEFWLH